MTIKIGITLATLDKEFSTNQFIQRYNELHHEILNINNANKEIGEICLVSHFSDDNSHIWRNELSNKIKENI